LKKRNRLSLRTSGSKSTKSLVAFSQKPMFELISDFEERIMVSILEAISDKDNVCRSFTESNESTNGCDESSSSESSTPHAQEISKLMVSKMTILLRPRALPLTCEALYSITQQNESNDDDIGFYGKVKPNYGHRDRALFKGAFPEFESSDTLDIPQRPRVSVSNRH
jgi:hypothetical protein